MCNVEQLPSIKAVPDRSTLGQRGLDQRVTTHSAADAQSFVTIFGTLRWMIDADVLFYLPISAIKSPRIQGIAGRILLLVTGRHVGIEADVQYGLMPCSAGWMSNNLSRLFGCDKFV